MTLDDEIRAVDDLVQTARSAMTEHLARATKDLRLGRKALMHYQDFLNATITNAESMLTCCREAASERAASVQASTSTAQGLLAATREAIRSMYAAMTVVEELAGPGGDLGTRQGGIAPATSTSVPRSCSFCGKTEAETKLVAGPEASICGSCTRLACGVLGIELSPSETE